MKDLELSSQFYSIEEVASFLGITVRTLRNRISAKRNHPPYIPGVYKFKKDAFDKWIRDHEVRQENKAS